MPIWKFCLLLIVLTLTSAPSRGARSPDEISFRLVQGFAIVMRGKICSLANQNILLDTGAVPSVLGARTARQLGLTGTAGSFALLHKDIEAEYATVDLVQIGRIRAVRLPVFVVDLARLERILGIRIDAILGLVIFAGSSFSVDYKSAKITRESAATRHAVADLSCPIVFFSHPFHPGQLPFYCFLQMAQQRSTRSGYWQSTEQRDLVAEGPRASENWNTFRRD
jgi:Aspartyl protease